MSAHKEGGWRIVEMELWAQEDVDLVVPAFLKLGGDGIGSFAFIAVAGQIDCRERIADDPRAKLQPVTPRTPA